MSWIITIPKHIAFIMDGSRRYAAKQNIPGSIGQDKGHDKLFEVLLWCSQLGIKEVTAFAFSIENFKRSPEEVEHLLSLARKNYRKFLEGKDIWMRAGVCIRAIGNLSLIPEDLRKIIAEAVLLTKDNKKTFWNIAFAYTSRDEITNSIKTICKGVEDERIEIDDITEDLISNCMYSSASLQVDLLIRTSGEVRFSDFLLWQIWNTNVIFEENMWPAFSKWNLLAAVFQYQRCYAQMQKTQEKKCVLGAENVDSGRVSRFLSDVYADRIEQLKLFANA